MSDGRCEQCDECGTELFAAGERVPAGVYLRVDDGSFHHLELAAGGILPASFDGHVALYRAGAAPCVCERRSHDQATREVRPEDAPHETRPQHMPAPTAADSPTLG